MNILIIAGHGGGDPGAAAIGYREDLLTRDFAPLCAEEIRRYADCTLADTALNWYDYLGGNSYNFREYDYVLEIHFNMCAHDPMGDGIVTGSEIYVPVNERGITVEEDILRNMSYIGFTNRGVKRSNFRVISRVYEQGVPAALLETAFIDDRDDMNLYQSRKKELAAAVAKGIAEGFGLEEEIDMEELARLSQKLTEVDDSLTNLYRSVNALIERTNAIEHDVYNLKNPMIYNYIDDNMPSWAREAVEELVKRGIVEGINESGELGLTYNDLRMLTINYRAGLYDLNK